MGWGYYGDYAPYVPVAQKKSQAVKFAAQQAKQAGRLPAPVIIQGRKIAKNFWGISWNENLEAYSDYANRLPRGRTYLCNGSVVDLQIAKGSIKAIVAGSQPYVISIEISELPASQWKAMKNECAGQIGSLVELLQGKLSKSVLEIVTRKGTGLFPNPKEIKKRCSCPDSAGLCKHLAAVLYAVGARLDEQPELLFKLRKVDHLELIEGVGLAAVSTTKSTRTKTIAANDLADMFGIEMTDAEPVTAAKPKRRTKSQSPTAVESPRKRRKVDAAEATAAKIPVKPPRQARVKSASSPTATIPTATIKPIAAEAKSTKTSKTAPRQTKSAKSRPANATAKPKAVARSMVSANRRGSGVPAP